MASSTAFVESLSALSDFLDLPAPLLLGGLAGDVGVEARAAVGAAPLAAGFAAFAFLDGFSFPESAARFVPAPERPPEQRHRPSSTAHN